MNVAEPPTEAAPTVDRPPARADEKPASPRVGCAGITVLTPPERGRVWVRRLSELLRAEFNAPVELVRLTGAAADRPLPGEALERRLYQHRGGLAELVSTQTEPGVDAGGWSDRLVFNLSGEDPARLPTDIQRAAVLTPTFEGAYALEALSPALLAPGPVHIGVVLRRDGVQSLLQGVAAAAPDREVLPAALDALLGRALELLLASARTLLHGTAPGAAASTPTPAPRPKAVAPGLALGPRRLAGVTAPKLARKFARPVLRRDWGIGYRRVQSEAAPDTLALSPADFRILDCPADHFYADPFIFRHDGVTALFFEDFDYRTELGTIAHVVLGEDGPCGPPVETLKRPYHLSYPFLFSHEGAALMIPETSASGTIELYEAEAFPARWRLRSVLLDGIDAADATLHFQAETGLWWLFAAVTRFGSSSHDTLSLFYSERLEGPWRPHAGNPVKLDPTSSRPAGPLVVWEGRLLRPAQDCARSYGAGVTWCEVDELSPTAFSERVVARRPAPAGYTGLHTFGRAAGYEVIDFERYRSPLAARWRARRNLSDATAQGAGTRAGFLRFLSLTASPPLGLGADFGEWGSNG